MPPAWSAGATASVSAERNWLIVAGSSSRASARLKARIAVPSARTLGSSGLSLAAWARA